MGLPTTTSSGFSQKTHCCTWVFSSWGKWGLLSSCSVQACLQWFLSWSTGSRAHSLQYLPHVGSVVVAPWLWSTGSVVWHTNLVAPRPVGSFPIRSQSGFPCISSLIFIQGATREAHLSKFLNTSVMSFDAYA